MPRMRHGIIGTAAVFAAFAAPTSAVAATYVVDPAAADGCATANGVITCRTISQAATASNNTVATTDTIKIKAGTYANQSPVTFSDSGVQIVANDPVAPRIEGTGSDPTITLTGGGAKEIERLIVLSSDSALEVSWSVPSQPSSLVVESSILSGAGSAAALRAVRGAGAGTLAVDGRHVTLADAGNAPAVDAQGSATVSLHDSLVKGDDSTADLSDNSIAASDALFVNPTAEDFHLRADATAAIDTGRRQGGGEVAKDVDGTNRPGDGWDRGADEFVNAPPGAPSISASTTSAQTGQTVNFTASGGADPNPGGSVVNWEWSFGDGAGAFGAGVGHAYASPGTYEVRAWALDNNGGRSDPSAPLTVTVTVPPPAPGPPPPPVTTSGGSPQALISGGATIAALFAIADSTPPAVDARLPRRAQRVKVGNRAPVLTGSVADEIGVHRVELALSRRAGSRCQWFDGRRGFRTGSCSRPRYFRAVVDDFAWRYAFPRAVRPRPGAYELRLRAFDLRGNGTAAGPGVPFRFVR